MNYLLVSKAQLIEKGIYTDAQELSDGRAVLSINAPEGDRHRTEGCRDHYAGSAKCVVAGGKEEK